MKKEIISTVLALMAFQGYAQRVLTYDDYLKNVCERNVEYLVEKFNIPIAEAKAQAAKIMPDPELSLSYENNQDRSLLMGQAYSAQIGYTLELGGKRRARIAVAKSEKQMTQALVEEYFRNLRADATLCYLDALKQKRLVALARSSYLSMSELARGDSLRYSRGDIAQVDAMQSRLEATTIMNDYLQVETQYRNALVDLVVFDGGAQAIDSLSGALPLIVRTYNMADLVAVAQDNRADIRAAIRNKELSVANLRLARANRVIDLGLNLGFAHNTAALNQEAPSPRHNTISAGVSIPLKFSAANKGELRAAQYAESQAQAQYDAVLLQIRGQVEQCYNRYISACRQAELYQSNTLTEATAILAKKKYSYLRGDTSLLEVLAAQRSCNEVYQAYSQVMYNASASLVELCRAAGVWEFEL